MHPIVRQLRSGAFYFIIPAAGAVSPLLVIPALTHTYGAAGWAAVAVAQSIGTSAGLIAELGWGVVGPQRVARADEAERHSLYQSAFATKLAACAVLAPLSALSAWLLAPSHQLAAALIGAASVFACLSPSWYLTGCNRPVSIFLIETVPRLAFALLAALAIYLGGPLELFGASISLAILTTIVLAARAIGVSAWPGSAAFHGGAAIIREQLPITLGRVVSVIYTALPITLVSMVSPASVASFAGVERLMRMFLTLLGGIPSRLQSWVGVAHGEERITRSRRSLRFNAALGLGGALFFAGVIPWIAPFIFSHAVHLPTLPVCIAAGVVFLVCTSRGYGLSLVAEGGANWTGLANLGAALVGVAAITGLAARWGVPGGLFGEVLCEAAGLGIQMFFLHFGRQWFAQRRKRR